MNPTNDPKNLSQYLDKILFVIAFFYLTVVVFWLLSQNKLELPFWAKSPERTILQNTLLTSSDSQFIDYLWRSLAAIDRRTAHQQKPHPSPTPFSLKQTLISVPGNSPLATSSLPKVAEKVYIPVYPPNSLPAAMAPGKIPVSSPVLRTASQTSLSPATVPVLTPGVQLLPSLNSSKTLIGLLESGDRSAALFNINGITQPTQIGEGISTTGWTLIAVENQKALIHRNGERRWIDVGQRF